MSELIRELAKQADEHEDAMDYIGNNYVGLRDDYLAELIIRKVIEELEVNKKGDIYTGELYNCEWNDCIDEQVEMLKNEFGIEYRN